jgi:auxin efflux carrier family protein
MLNYAFTQLRWSYGVRLLAQADPEPIEPPTIYRDEPEPLIDADETAFPPPPHERGDPLLDIEEQPSRAATLFNIDHHANFHHQPLHPPPPSSVPRRPQQHRTHSSFFRSFPNSPEGSPSITRPTSPSLSSDISDDGSRFHHIRTHVLPGKLTVIRQRLASTWKTFNEFMTVPLWAALASIVVACVYPLQHALLVHITPVKGAIERAGDCSIPITLVVLGGYFYTPPPEADNTKPPISLSHRASASVVSLVSTVKEFLHLRSRNADENGNGHDSSSTLAWGDDSELGRRRTGDDALLTATRAKGRPGETKTVFIAVLSRMILTPLALLPLMTLAAKYDWHSVFEE